MTSRLSQDLDSIVSRRRALGLLGLGAGGIVLGGAALAQGFRPGGMFGPPPGGPGGPPPMEHYDNVVGTTASGEQIVAFPPETNGPFPADGTNGRAQTISVFGKDGLVRSDIRPSFAGLTGSAQGVPLDFTLRLVDVDHGGAPLAGKAIYVWHCDAGGQYSLYNVTDANYLRGVQITDAKGEVRFRSIFPACYDGRWPHIHFEVFDSLTAATTGRDSLLTSQLALPLEEDRKVYRDAAIYVGSTANLGRLSFESDNVFGDNTPEQRAAQLLRMSGSPTSGYQADALIGLTAKYRKRG